MADNVKKTRGAKGRIKMTLELGGAPLSSLAKFLRCRSKLVFLTKVTGTKSRESNSSAPTCVNYG